MWSDPHLNIGILGEGDTMWKCPKCQVQHEDAFEVCWNCGTSKEGVEDPAFSRVDESAQTSESSAQSITEDPTFSRVDEGVQTPEFNAQSITADQPKRRRPPRASVRTIAQLIYVGLSGYALALDRDTGEIVWSNNEMRSGYVSLLLDGDRLIVSTNGYMYCLDPLTGQIRWHNPLSGYGTAPTSLISARGQSSASLIQQAADEADELARSAELRQGHDGTV